MRTRPDRLFALILWAGLVPPAGAQEAVFVSDLPVRSDAAGFGGLSAIEIDAAGRDVVLLSDRGTLFRGVLSRDATGHMDGLRILSAEPLLDAQGGTPDRGARDSEGLALLADGQLFVSFEGAHRVAAYVGAGHSTDLPGYPGFDGLAVNGSLEGVAVDQAGRLYTFPEDGDGAIPVFRFADGAWSVPFEIARPDRFKPVGADFDPQGRLILLERAFHPLFGFATRLRRFVLSEDAILGQETLLTTGNGRHGNLEGIAVWQDGTGRAIATLVSDDNFNPLFSTSLVEYILPD